MNPWFVANALPHKAKELTAEFPWVEAWFARVRAIGHGTPSDMTPGEALDIAKAATSTAQEAADPHGRKPGDAVAVAADDYGRDPVRGALVFATSHEIAIRRTDSRVGEVVVHFPRAGFNVTPA